MFVCQLAAIVSLVLASSAKKEIEGSYGRLTGLGLVTASRVISIISLALLPLILLAVALPTFFGAQERAQDRAVQSDLRNAISVEQVLFTDSGAWTTDLGQLAAVEPGLRWEFGEVPVAEDVVYVYGDPAQVGLSGRSGSGTCFYVAMRNPADRTVEYAQDDGCGPITAQDFGSGWR